MKQLLLTVLTALLLVAFISCGGDDNPTESVNHAPTVPIIASGAPANGASGIALTPVLQWTCTDSDGDAITYTVYFGEAASPPSVSSSQSAASYDPGTLEYSTTYYWKIDAEDPDAASSSSAVWSFTTMAEPGPETVSTPAIPSGPATGEENESLSYTLSGAVSSIGDGLQYRIDWGDGNISLWGTTTVSNLWATAGTYYIKAQARCVTHNSIISDWSDSLVVTITVPGVETITTPGTPTGSGAGEEGESINFATAASTSSLGHSEEYRWDFGEGSFSTWSSVRSRSNSWATAGTYEVKAQARCATHTDIISAWSGAKSVTITVPAAETISTPVAPTAPATAETGVNIVVTNLGGGVSSDGHPVAYRIDFGDGDITAWYNTLITIQHAYATAGSYDIAVQARCRTHTSIESAWSATTSIAISDPAETIPSPPDSIYGIIDGGINESYEYTAYHSSQTNLSDAIEGRFDWGDGTYSAWIAVAPYTASHTWTTEGTYTVNYQARCATHTSLTADANPLTVVIATVATETITKPGYFSMQTHQRYPDVDSTVTYYAYGGLSSLGHATEVMIDWGDGTQSAWVDNSGAVTKVWTTAGTYGLTRITRCKDHPSILSEWSDPIDVYPRDLELVNAPVAPIGPSTGIANEWLAYTATGAVTTWGHSTYLEYRFDWGDGSALTAWSSDTTQGHQFPNAGTFDIITQARDVYPGHTAPESDWSPANTVTVMEEITLNSSCYGPEAGAINVSLNFYAYSAATSSEGHTIEYRFDFDDGTISDWSTSLSADHIFTVAGKYYVKYQARCATHTEAMSDWSNSKVIDVTDDPEALTNPYVDTFYEINFDVGEEAHVAARGSETNYGDSLEYQIDFGDGTVIDWTPASYSIAFKWEIGFDHTYTTVGTYDIKCQSRCRSHPSVLSNWSALKSVNILEAIPSMPEPTGPTTGTVGETLTYETVGTTSSEGHTLEYSFQIWGYSSMISETPFSSSLTYGHVFTSTGSTYRVRVVARCATHTNAIAYSTYLGYITITAK